MAQEPPAEVLRRVASRAEETTAGEARLRALFDAVTAISGGLELRPTLERIIRAAARLADARYAALGVLDPSGQEVTEFVTHGIDAETRAAIGRLPRGRGILGLLIRDPRPLRLEDLSSHPASYGIPPGHPPMRTFLGVPIRVGHRVFGNLYLTEKNGGAEFTPEDEAAVASLAVAAAVAIRNAALYTRSERQARRLRATAEIQGAVLEQRRLDDVLQLVVDLARQVSGGESAVLLVREGGEPLRVEASSGSDADVPDELRELAEDLVDGGVVVHHDPDEVGWGLPRVQSALLVPFTGPDDSSGVLLTTRTTAPLGTTEQEELDALRSFADQTSIAFRLASAQADRAELAVAHDRDRIARDLHDVVIQRLFGIGLTLQRVGGTADDAGAREQLTAAVDQIDHTIRDLRSAIFQLERDRRGTGLRGRIMDTVADTDPGVRVELSMRGPVDLAVPRQVQDELLAVLVEALSNTARHADAGSARVHVTVDGQRLALTVTDDGVGFVPGHRRSGIRNMEERALALGGSCEIDSTPGDGTTVHWTVPLPR